MKYEEYVEKYNYCYGHENYNGGELFISDLDELLDYLRDEDYPCPEKVMGGIPVKITLDPDWMIDSAKQLLWDHDFSGEDYEMPEKGKEFLRRCFETYNKEYATNGNYCDSVEVDVPEHMRYELVEARHEKP